MITDGDFNAVLNPALNKSGNSNRKSSETIQQFMADFGLGDGG